MRHQKRLRLDPTDEIWLSALLLLGPLAYVVRWIWRWLKELSA